MESVIDGGISKSRFVVTIIACSVILIPGGGVCYGFSAISPYLLSYNYHHSNNTSLSFLGWIYANYMIGHAFGMIATGLLEQRLPLRLIATVAIVTFNVTLFLAYWLIYSTVTLCGTYFVLGFTLGLLYSAVQVVGLSWVKPDHYGKISGAITFGYGIASVFISPLQTLYVNPGNVAPDHVNEMYVFRDTVILRKVAYLYVIYGILSTCLQLPLSFLLIKNPTHIPRNLTFSTFLGRLRDIVATWQFWVLYVVFGLNKIPLAYTAAYSKLYGELFIHSDIFLSVVMGMAGLFNALGRPTWGWVKDRIGIRNSIIMLCFATSLAIVTWFASRYVPVKGLADLLFLVGVWASMLTCCGNFAIFPAITVSIFGQESFAITYGVLYTSQGMGSLLSALLSTWVPTWVPLALTVAVITVVSGAFALSLKMSSGSEILEEKQSEGMALMPLKGSSAESISSK